MAKRYTEVILKDNHRGLSCGLHYVHITKRDNGFVSMIDTVGGRHRVPADKVVIIDEVAGEVTNADSE